MTIRPKVSAQIAEIARKNTWENKALEDCKVSVSKIDTDLEYKELKEFFQMNHDTLNEEEIVTIEQLLENAKKLDNLNKMKDIEEEGGTPNPDGVSYKKDPLKDNDGQPKRVVENGKMVIKYNGKTYNMNSRLIK